MNISPVRPLLHLGCAVALVVSAGACSVSVGRPSEQAGTSQHTSQSTAQAESPSAATPSADPQQGDRVAEPSTAAAPAASPAVAPSGASGPDAQAGRPEGPRPGAAVQIIDDKWLELLNEADKTVSPINGQVVLSADFEDVIIDGDVMTLSIPGRSVYVVADYVENLVVDGNFVEVYVRDVKNVTINGNSVRVSVAALRHRNP